MSTIRGEDDPPPDDFEINLLAIDRNCTVRTRGPSVETKPLLIGRTSLRYCCGDEGTYTSGDTQGEGSPVVTAAKNGVGIQGATAGKKRSEGEERRRFIKFFRAVQFNIAE